MFFQDPYKEQLIKRIESLIAGGNYEKANTICLEVLEKDPDDSDMFRLVKLIEDKVQKENERIIDNVLNDLEPLWKEEKYMEIIQKLNDLKKYSKEYPPLLEAISKAETRYRKIVDQRSAEELKRTRDEFEALITAHRLDEVVNKCFEIEESSLKNPETEKLAEEMKLRVVDIQLAERKDFLKSDKYDEILGFLENLLTLVPRYEKLKNMIEEMKIRKVNNFSADREETFYKGADNIKNLLRLEKYEEAYLAAHELCEFNPSSKEAQNLLKESQEKYDVLLRNDAIKHIKENLPKLKSEYENNKDDFTTL